MRRRLMTSIIAALLGVVAAPWLNQYWDLAPLVAMGVCAVGGVVLGYVASMLFDVFTGDLGPTTDSHRD